MRALNLVDRVISTSAETRVFSSLHPGQPHNGQLLLYHTASWGILELLLYLRDKGSKDGDLHGDSLLWSNTNVTSVGKKGFRAPSKRTSSGSSM